MSDALPPPQPNAAPQPMLWSNLALVLAIVAFVFALPILWWKLVAAPVGTTVVAEAVRGVADAIRAIDGAPEWVIRLRALAVLSAFLALISVVLALILKNQRRNAGIATVLALAALAVTSPLLMIGVLGGLIAVAVVLFSVGLM